MVFDPVRGKLVLFGGLTNTNTLLADTWEWDGMTWTEITAAGPPARFDHALAYDATRGKAVLFGGGGATGNRADTWEWDGSTWTQRTPTTSPPARTDHAMAFDLVRGRVLLFSGSNGANDTWEWDGTN